MAHSEDHKTTQPDNDEETFYESLPATFGDFAGTAPEEPDAANPDDQLFTDDQPERWAESEARFNSIVTIVLITLVAIILGLLFLRGLDVLKSNLPSRSDTSSSLEL